MPLLKYQRWNGLQRTAWKNRQEIIEAGLSRRDLFKMGIATDLGVQPGRAAASDVALSPGSLIVARYGDPTLVRRFNDLSFDTDQKLRPGGLPRPPTSWPRSRQSWPQSYRAEFGQKLSTPWLPKRSVMRQAAFSGPSPSEISTLR